MRYSVKSDEVFHLWAAQSQSHATGAGNISFSGETAFSYSAVIGNIVTNERGERLFLVSDYQDCFHYKSVTTSKHLGMLRRAIPNTEKIVHVYSVIGSPETNLRRLVDALPARIMKVGRARENANFYMSELQNRISEIKLLSDFYDLPRPELPEMDAESLQLAAEGHAAVEKQRNAELKVEVKNKLELWQAGKTVRIPYTAYSYLRVSPDDPNTVETTQGANVPLADVRAAAPLLLRIIKSGQIVNLHGRGPTLGYYKVNSITKETVVVGCHTFRKSEIIRFAKVIGETAGDLAEAA